MRTLLKIVPALVLLAACSDDNPQSLTSGAPVPITSVPVPVTDANPQRNAYFGDLHVHTMYSYDAFFFGTTSSPDDAYNFAKGGSLKHAAGFDMKLDVPLDFYAVTDHAYYLGIMREMSYGNSAVARHEVAQGMNALDDDIVNRRALFARFRDFSRSDRKMEIMDNDVVKSAWSDIIETANRHNEPAQRTG